MFLSSLLQHPLKSILQQARFGLLMAFALSAFGSQAQTAQLLLVNAGSSFIQVQRDDRSVLAEIAPGASATVTVSRYQWIRRDNMAYRYNTSRVQRLKRKGHNITLQMDAKAVMYLMSADSGVEVSRAPAQPQGFPLRPDKKYVLR